MKTKKKQIRLHLQDLKTKKKVYDFMGTNKEVAKKKADLKKVFSPKDFSFIEVL